MRPIDRKELAAHLRNIAAGRPFVSNDQVIKLHDAAALLEAPSSAEREALAAQLMNSDAVTDDMILKAANMLRAMPSCSTPEAVEEARKHRATLRVMWSRNFPDNVNGAAQKDALGWAAFSAGPLLTPEPPPLDEAHAKAYLNSMGWTCILTSAYEAQQARAAADAPIPMILRCPHCNTRHVDEGDFAVRPHKTHACQNPACGELFTPALVPTVGVRFLPGCKNEVKS